MIVFTDQFFKSISEKTNKKKVVFNNNEIDLTKKFNIISMKELFEKYLGVNPIDSVDSEIKKIAKKHKVDIDKKSGRGKMIEKIFSQLVEPNLIEPTFVIDYPVEISPLARYKRGDSSKKYVERFELFISGVEFANAFSELNDPEDQKKRLMDQNSLLEKGDGEAQMYDKDFIKVLEASHFE